MTGTEEKNKSFEEHLDREFDEGLEEFQRTNKRRVREETTKRIILQQQSLLRMNNPLEEIISTLDEVDNFCQYRNKIVALDQDLTIKGLTRSAKRLLDYHQKHNPPDFIGRPYEEFFYEADKKIFLRNIEKRVIDKNSMQRIVIPGRRRGRVHIKSTILSYRYTRKKELYGVFIGWSGIKFFGLK